FIELARVATSAAFDEDGRYRADTEAAAQRFGVDRTVILERIGLTLLRDGRYALGTIAQRTPAQAPRALQAWLEAAVSINTIRGVESLFDSGSALGHDATGLGVFDRAAHAAPRSFVEAVLPVMLCEWQRTAKNFSWTPIGSGEQTTGLRCTRYLLNL